jgi:endonuclease/exonuclease/phosphatase (EEP) superfamily protein YafD
MMDTGGFCHWLRKRRRSEAAVVEEEKPSAEVRLSLGGLLFRLVRRAVQVLTFLAAGAALGLWVFLNFVGYHNPASAFLLFMPAWLWCLPAMLMLPLALILDFKKSGLLALITVVVYLGLLLGWKGSSPSPRKPAGEVMLSVLTYNRGQAQGTSLQPFKAQVMPDVIAMQDAGRRAMNYKNADGYQEFTHVDGVGEFVLLSKHPIISKELLSFAPSDNPTMKVPVAARFQIEMATAKVAIYSVHLPTPRPILQSERWGGFLWGILGFPGTSWAQKRETRQQYWDGKLSLATQLADAIRAEQLPCVVVGDFNTPALGTVYRMFASDLQDGHLAAGQGYGYTFPGVTNNPAAFGQPWLRLDHVFADEKHWRFVQHVTEPDRGSQHRAVFAQLTFSP